ncbi:Sporulation related domain-containing protein [Arboricoccus pini]|uniref:Sporulation related domain-containing protein n=2 Tax=Arboricoccus pini TaxID=1963835 RepID=A0A212QQI3_9PROT|nr:Sporulation related domain-containing protein [Arboricoccus pini]
MEENRNKPPAFARYRREAGRQDEESSSQESRPSDQGSHADGFRQASGRPSQGVDGPAPGVGGFRPRHAANMRPPGAGDIARQDRALDDAPRRPGLSGPATPSPALRQNIFARGAQRRADAARGQAAPGRLGEGETGPREMGSPAGAAPYGRDPRSRSVEPVGAAQSELTGNPGLRGLEQGTASGVRHIMAEDRSRPLIGRKTIIVGVLAALVFGLFGTVVYLGYRQTLGFSGEVPLVRAPDKPYKEPPDAGGGADLASEGSNVMGVFSGRGDDARVEKIMPRGGPAPMSLDQADPGLRERADSQVDLALLEPPPLGPVPAAPASAAPQPAAVGSQQASTPASPAPSRADISASRTNPATTTSAMPVSPRQQPAPAGSSGTASAAPSQATTPPPTPSLTVRPSSQATVGGASAPRSLFPSNGRTPTPATASPSTQVAALPAPSAPAPAPLPAGGAWRVQLAAVGSRQAAEDAWRIIRQRNPAVATLPVNYVEAQIGTAHVVRVQAGAFAARDEAAQTCQILRAAGSDCFVVGATR